MSKIKVFVMGRQTVTNVLMPLLSQKAQGTIMLKNT